MDIQFRLWPPGGRVGDQGRGEPVGFGSWSSLLQFRLLPSRRCVSRQSVEAFRSIATFTLDHRESIDQAYLCAPIPSPGRGVLSVSWWSSTLPTPSARSPGSTVCTWRRSLSVSTTGGAYLQTRHWKGTTMSLPPLAR